ncbi:hypothetical protein H6P81_014490 [Aristolochia fimbriata]|uniref:Uncharacterized protein n=1 Tax=Aristolochia fimbriata TaxID=158543 RepID=A0AAV7ELA4_ARIFI|nr:hypothetical protein H6P81_014490 [Aristolochia fimbriata]
MGTSRGQRRFVSQLVLFLLIHFCACARGSSIKAVSAPESDSLCAALRDYAFDVLRGPHIHSGVLYRVPLPANYSGVRVNVTRLRIGSFWARGVKHGSFRIPPFVQPMPYARRVAIVYRDLGSWSSSFYDVPGYSLAAPVLGFLIYNATSYSNNGSIEQQLDLRVLGAPISVDFSEFAPPKGWNSLAKCVMFHRGRVPYLTEMTFPSVCLTANQGHFSVVIPSALPLAPSPSPLPPRKKKKEWNMWAIAVTVSAVAGLILFGLIAFAVFKIAKRKKIGEMERRADEGEVLGSHWIGGSKLPSATSLRTQPVLEQEFTP